MLFKISDKCKLNAVINIKQHNINDTSSINNWNNKIAKTHLRLDVFNLGPIDSTKASIKLNGPNSLNINFTKPNCVWHGPMDYTRTNSPFVIFCKQQHNTTSHNFDNWHNRNRDSLADK